MTRYDGARIRKARRPLEALLVQRHDPSIQQLTVRVRGAVQGVGFRPFVYRLASALQLRGEILNDTRGVLVEVEGPEPALRELLRRLPEECPPLAVIHSVEAEWSEASCRHQGLTIRASRTEGRRTAVVLPDAATCADCLRELRDPADRRHGYAFINCTNCGPRFSIVEGLPYDRPNTTMRGFALCERCRAEYDDPLDRRFHAQPNACPECGPALRLERADGTSLCRGREAIEAAAGAIRDGRILALKGLGGYQLLVRADSDDAVGLLRRRKHRPDKPLAVMVRDLQQARGLVELPAAAAELLTSVAAPIVLLRRRPGAVLAANLAPGNPWLGIMVPYSPLHHLLLDSLEGPVVATSGNLSDEPICIDDEEARRRLGAIADLFLAHDRPIARHVDDAVVRLLDGAPQVIRRARGMAPQPLRLPASGGSVLALGAHMKNTVGLAIGDRAFLSQHIGDLETPGARAAFTRVIGDFLRLYEARPVTVAHDLHPDSFGSAWAAAAVQPGGELEGTPLIAVQHHHAHLAACLAEHRHDGPALGIVWDGTGYGPDGTVWGGEFLLGDAAGFRRVARLRPFLLPGGDSAVRHPARVALAMLWECNPDEDEAVRAAAGLGLERPAARVLATMLQRRVRSPWTSSAGRLFDGLAALLGFHREVSFEGQAAMALEFLAGGVLADPYPMPVVAVAPDEPERAVTEHPALEIDWRPAVRAVRADCAAGADAVMIARRVHAGLIEAAAGVASRLEVPVVALSGGCFQNALLSESMAARLRRDGFDVLVHRQVPPNDGGIALGQLAVAARRSPVREPIAEE